MHYLSLTEAIKRLPTRVSISCVWRWCRKGLKSRSGEIIRLGHVRIGGRIFTTEADMHQFFRRVAEADVEHFERIRSEAPVMKRTKTRSAAEQESAHDRAMKELKARGIC